MLVLMMMVASFQGLPPHSVKMVQDRTMFANDEPVVVTLRLSNPREKILRARKWPDLIEGLTVTRNGKALAPAEKRPELFRRSESLGINAHRDFRIDLRRFYPDLRPGEVYSVRYEDTHSLAEGKKIRVVDLPMPSTDTRFRVRTSLGDFVLELSPEHAPDHSRNFALLVATQFYKNMIWHRVVPGVIVQTGDPLGTGEGGSGFSMTLETSPFMKHEPYALGMARGPDLDSASSQFYVCLRENEMLDGKYTVFGKVVEGFAVVDALGSVRTSGPNGQPPERPVDDVALISIDVVSD